MVLVDVASRSDSTASFPSTRLTTGASPRRLELRSAAHQLIAGSAVTGELAIAKAQAALNGLLVLPGTGARQMFVGNPPDWFANPVGDIEYTWTLNRMEHWIALLRGWLLTDDPRYADKVVAELRDWLARCHRPPIDPARFGADFNNGSGPGTVRTIGKVLERWPGAHRAARKLRMGLSQLKNRRRQRAMPPPPPLGQTPYNPNPWRSLEAGARMVHVWPVLLELLPDLVGDDPQLHAALTASAAEHGEVLAVVSPMLWPNADHNHYLMECLGLMATATQFPQLPQAAQWAEQATSEIERCARAQFTDDGGHIEGCPHYHNVCVYLLARSVYTASLGGITFSEALRERLVKSLNHCLHTMRPSGSGVPAGDSDADRLAIQATLFAYLATGEADTLRKVVEFTGRDALLDACFEHFWHIPNVQDVIALATEPLPARASASLPLVSWQRQLKQATMRTDWGKDAISLFFACRTPIHNGHAHADPASFDLTALGVPLLADPGRMSYAEGPARRAIKSAAYHNTVTVDGREPFEYLSSMHFGPQREGEITALHEQPRLLAAEAAHHNYSPAIHRRLLAIIDGSAVLVLDLLEKLGRNSRVQVYYHVDTERVSWSDERRTATARVADVNVAINVTANLQGQSLGGKVAPMLDTVHDSTRLRFEDQPGVARRCYAGVIVPTRAVAPSPTIEDLRAEALADTIECAYRIGTRKYKVTWQPQSATAPSNVTLSIE